MSTRKLLTSATLFVVLALALSACSDGGKKVAAASDVTPVQTTAATDQVSPVPTPITLLPTASGEDEGEAETAVEAPATDVDRSDFVVQIEEPTTGTEAPDAEPVAEAPPAEAPPGELQEGCLDAAPVADVTIPDGAVLNPGETFTKIWRIRNAGTCEWSDALGQFLWASVGGDQMNGPSQVPIVGPVPPGGEYDVEVELTAPAQPGLHEGRWQVQGPKGDPIGVLFWVLIEVAEEDAPLAAGGLPSSDVPDLAQEIWRGINGERDRYKLYQLAYNEKLALAAQSHAEDCSQRGSCSHTGSDGSDESVRVRRVGFEGSVDESWVMAASPLDAVNWWLDEVPPNDWHRRMLLSDYFKEVGVGVAPADYGYYFVAVFGLTGR